MLDATLSSSRELSGALNRVLPALRRIRREGRFSETATVQRQLHEFTQTADPLAQWLAVETTSGPSASIPQESLHAAYALTCTNANRPVMTKQMFGRRLRALRPDIQEAQRAEEGKRQWVYLGIGLKSEHNTQALAALASS